MTDTGLLTTVASLGTHQRAIDGRHVTLAGNLAHRSRLSLGADGMARNAGYAKPALFLAAIWTITVGEQGDRADDGRCDRSLFGDDDRTLDQFRSDAAEQLFRHVASCEGHGGNILSIRMVIRMTKESPLIGLGVAEIDGVNETIAAGCAFGGWPGRTPCRGGRVTFRAASS